jgi:hypothetical protein
MSHEGTPPMTVQTTPARASAQVSWLAASAAALVAVAVVNGLAGEGRWWANFILLPGAAAVAAAVPLIRSGRAAAGYAVASAGAVVCTVGTLLIFAAMTRGWPLMIIVPCLVVAGTARWRARDANARAAHWTLVGLAVLGAVLGVTFLVMNAGLIDLDGTRWWGVFMIAAGAVAVGNGLSLAGDIRGYRLSTTVMLAGLGFGAIMAGLRELLWR